MLLVLAAARPADAAACLPGGAVNLCEQPVDGKSPGAKRVGGTLVADGWKVDQKGDYITYDLGATVASGAVRFDVTGVSDAALSGDTHIVFLLNDSLDPKAPAHQIEVVLWGSAVDPNAVGTLNLGVSGPQGGRTNRGKLPWSGGSYRFDVTFDQAAQVVTLSRDGALLFTVDTAQNGVPLEMAYRYAHLALPCCINNAAYQPVVGADYTLFSIAADPGEAPADMAEPADLARPRDLSMAPAADLASPKDGGGKRKDLEMAADLGDALDAGVPADLARSPDAASVTVAGGCSIGSRRGDSSLAALALLAALLLLRRRS
jgi:hypothetical protein